MVEKGPGLLDERVRIGLKKAACELHLRGWDKMNMIDSKVCTGTIETEWKTFSVGARSGVLFKAQITEETGDYKVNFLLNTRDLERGAEVLREMEEGGDMWVRSTERFPVPELYEFGADKRNLN